MPPFPKFYVRDGWTFSREGAGRVHIVKRDKACDDVTASPIIAEITLTSDEWAGIIAQMSHLGETVDSFTDAQFIHMGHFRKPVIGEPVPEPGDTPVPIPVSIVKPDISK